jgi:hypothetical protein
MLCPRPAVGGPLTQALGVMDSKLVNREIKKAIWPALKAAGFGRFTSRVAWRSNPDSVDVVEFQSFNKYNADVLGVTTFSFSVNLGKFLLYIPPQWAPKVKEGIHMPSEPDCLFRGHLLPQVSAAPSNRIVWSVDVEGKNLLWCIKDVLSQLTKGLDWFSRLEDKTEVLRVLLERDEDMDHLWGFGRNPSPTRSYHAGYVALALGDGPTAIAKLQEAVDSKCYTNLFASVEGAINRAA